MRAFIFDLDGTLIDVVYAHVVAWQRTLIEAGMAIDGWYIHRRIGMSGGLFMQAVARELGRSISEEEGSRLERRHYEFLHKLLPDPPPVLPGAQALLKHLEEAKIPHGIATSGRRPDIDPALVAVGLGPGAAVVERGEVAQGKPEPDLFLACQQRLGVAPQECYVVGDAVWDILAARRAGMLSLGLLTGGYGEEELYRAGAFRVYRDVGELHRSLDELGV